MVGIPSFFTKFFKDKEKNKPELNLEGIGTCGTSSYDGDIQEDYLEKLTGTQAADIYDKMRRSDPQIKMLTSAIKNQICSADWKVEKNENIKNFEQMKEVLEYNLEKIDIEQVIKECASVIEFGFSVHEIIHKPYIKTKVGTFSGIGKVAFRSQRTIEKWNVEKKTSELISVTQRSYGDSDFQGEIPAKFLMILSLDKEGANYAGISMLRPCYGGFIRKNAALKNNSIGIDRFSVKPVIAQLKEPVSPEEMNKLKNALKTYRTQEEAYIIVPAHVEIKTENTGFDPTMIDASIDSEDRRMTKAFLANFLELGINSGSGSFSLSKDLSDFFLSGIDSVADMIRRGIQESIINPIVDMTFGPQDIYPKFTYSGISSKAGLELSQILTNLYNSNLITPDDKIETYLRTEYALPDMDMETQRKKQDVAQPTFSEESLKSRFKKLVELKRK